MNKSKYNPLTALATSGINQLLDDLGGQSLSNIFNHDLVLSSPSVNILEEQKSYIIELAAPGLSKSDFDIELDNDHLTISVNNSERKEDQDDDHKFTRREFGYHSFKRRFHLSDDIIKDKIDARYEKGILSIVLYKKEEAQEIRKKIVIE